MTAALKTAMCGFAAVLAGATLCACGSTGSTRRSTSPARFVTGQLQAFQLPQAGSAHAAQGRTWQQYGSRPVGAVLTINPMTLYDAGRTPLVLLGVRQARPTSGLVFGAQLVTLTPGFDSYAEYVNRGTPADAFGAHANFSPLRGFTLSPDPKAVMAAGTSPTVVLTATATRPGVFHIGDWVIAYRVGSVRHTVTLVDDGSFCAGSHGCPSL